MYDEQDRKWLYNELQSAGYKTGSYDEFKESLNNQEDRDWYYEESKKLGLEVGSADDFASMMVEPQKTNLVEKAKAAAESGTFPFVGSVGSQQGVSAENEKKPLWKMSAELGMQGRANREGVQRMESIKKGSALGNAFGGGKEPLTGKRYTESGEETNELGQWYDAQKNNQQRKAEADFGSNIEEQFQEAERKLHESAERDRQRANENESALDYLVAGMQDPNVMTGPKLPEDSEETKERRAIYNALKEADKIVKAAQYSEKHNGWQEFWKSFGKKIGDWETWDMGVSSMLNNGTALRVIKKLEAANGDETKLTDSERDLLDALATQAVVEQYYHDRIGKGYNLGSGVAESVPFMAEMIINPMSGAGSATGKALGKYILKRFGVKGTMKGVMSSVKNKALKQAGKELAGTVVRDVASEAAHLAGSAGMASTTGLANVIAGSYDRQIGKVTGNIGLDGSVDYTGRQQYEANARKAFWKEWGSRTIENFSETGMGAANEAVGDVTTRLIGKMFKGSTAKMVSKAYNGWRKFKKGNFGQVMKRAQWQGMVPEWLEEVEGGIANAIVVGDQTLDTDPETGVFNPGNMWDTFLQVAATSMMIGGGHVASYGIGKGVEAWSNANRLRQSDKEGQTVFGVDSWDDVKQAVEGAVRGISVGADGIGLSEEGKAAMRGLMEGRSQDEKQAIVDYFGARVKSEVSSAMIADETMTDDERELQNDYSRGYEAMMQSYDEDSEDADQRSMLAASDMAIERDQKRTALAERIGEEAVSELEQSRLGGSDIDDQLARMMDEGKIGEGDMEAVKDYMKAHAAYRGVEDFVNEAGDAVSRQARMETAPTRDEQGNVRKATMKNGKTLYIKGGDVKVQKDGTIDTEGSTEALTAYDPEEEKNVFVNVDDIESMEEKGSDEVEREIEQQGSDFKEAMLNEINGVNTLGVGKEVTAENGMRGIVVAEDADNYILQMEDGQQVAVNKEQYEQELQARRMADYEQRHGSTTAEVEEEVREETPEGTETTEEVPSMEATEGAPDEVVRGMEIVFKDREGNEVEGVVNELGNNRYWQGNHVFVPAEKNQPWGIIEVKTADGDITHIHKGDIVRHKQPAVSGQQTVEEAPTEEDETSRRIHELLDEVRQMERERSGENVPEMQEEVEAEPEDAAQVVYDDIKERYGEKTEHKIEVTVKDRQANMEAKRKALVKAQQEYDDAPIGKEEKAEKAVQKAQQEYEEAQTEYENWREVKSRKDQEVLAIKEEEDRRRREAEAIRRAEAEARAAEARKREEAWREQQRAEAEAERKRMAEQEEFERITANRIDVEDRAEERSQKLAEAKSVRQKEKIAKEIYGEMLGEMGETTDQFDTDVYEYVAAHMPKNLRWDGPDGLQKEIGSDKKRGIGKQYESNMFNKYLAPNGQGTKFGDAVHNLWRSEVNQKVGGNLDARYTEDEIRDALLDLLLNEEDIEGYVLNHRIEVAEAEKQAEENRIATLIEDEWIMEHDGLTKEEYYVWVKELEARAAAVNGMSEEEYYKPLIENEYDEQRETNHGTVPAERAGEVGDTGSGNRESAREGEREEGEPAGVEADGERGADEQQTEVAEQIEAARQQVETQPTEGQKEAGNYAKGHLRLDGYDISLEQPKGSVRSGKDADGREWSQEMHNDYGYIRGTEGVDGDHIDVFLSDNPTEGNVFVVDQVNPKTGEFDEHKVMYGFTDMESARKAYLSNYEEGWKGLGAITEVSKEEFKKWVESSRRKTKPFAEYKSVKAEGGQSETSDYQREAESAIADILDGVERGTGVVVSPEMTDAIQKIADMEYEAEERLENENLSDEERARVQAQYDAASKWMDDNVRSQKAEGETAKPTKEQKELTKGVVEVLKETGVPTHYVTKKGQEMLDKYRELVQFMNRGNKKTTSNGPVPSDESPFKAGSTSEVDGAKIAKNLDTLIKKAENYTSEQKKGFIEDIAKILGTRRYGSNSEYATFETKNGEVTLRLADHNATVSNFDHSGKDNGVSIVISRKPNNGITNDGDAHIVEYFYPDKVLKKADGTPYADIVHSIQQMIYSGEYKDNTGLAQRQEVNADDVLREMRAWHGSAADFEKFESSHIGEGMGVQRHGHGFYVTTQQGRAKGYAQDIAQNKTHYLYKGEEIPLQSNALYKAAEIMTDSAIKTKRDAIEEAEYEKSRILPENGSRIKLWDEIIDIIKSSNKNDFTIGREVPIVYEVEIPEDNGSNYIDWTATIPKSERRRIAEAVRAIPEERLTRENHGNNWLPGGFGQLADMIERNAWGGMDIYDRLYDATGSTKLTSDLLSKLGYKGVRVHEWSMPEGENTYVIFDDGDLQIKDKIRFQKAADGSYEPDMKPVFYSNAERAVEGIKQEKATAEQWLKMIEKNGGLKAGEDKWTGLSEWLKSNDKKSLTKQQVMDYIRENQIQVEDVEYEEGIDIDNNPQMQKFREEFNDIKQQNEGGRSDLEVELDKFEDEMYDKYGSGWYNELNDEEIERMEQFNDLSSTEGTSDEKAFREMVDRYGDDFSMAFEVDGNGVLVPINDPYNDSGITEQAEYFLEFDKKPINETRLGYTTDGLDNKREIALVVPTIESWNEGDQIHFGDAGGGRAVAWVRFGETTDADGKKVLVIDEIQSKRHQEGREKGYVSSEQKERHRKLGEDVKKAEKEYNDYTADLWNKYKDSSSSVDEMLSNITEEEGAKVEELRDRYNKLSEEWSKDTLPADAIPDAPFEKNWHEVAMKRMLRYAAENGYDKVAWTKGEQQAERYDLSKEIREIKIRKDGRTTPEGEALYEVYTYDNNTDREIAGASGMFNATRLKETFGKELAERLENVAKESQSNGAWDNWGSINGDGLRIGGEGMKGFYDQILPRFMDKYNKKWGIKTGDAVLPELGDNGLTMWSVDVTPEMRESVMEGQPMFFKTEEGEVLGYTLNGEIYIDPRVATPDTPIHEYTHLWAQGLRSSNPTAWAKLTEEMKGVEDGRLWEYVRGRYPELKNEDELTDEVFAHYSGKRGRERLEADMREEMSKTHDVFEKAKVATMFHKLREILSKFWNMARDLFAGKVEGIEKLTAEDFADMVLGDLARGYNPVRARTEQSKALDKEYMEAVERGDMETAQRMVNEAAERAGYTTDEDYKMTHTAPNGRDGFSKSIDDPSGLYPDDLYSPNGARYYGDGEEWMDRASAAIFRRVHNNPDAMVKIYRAVPKSLKETKLRNGDWVSINREYAKEHGERNINGGYKIIEDEVPAKYVYTDANSLHEQGYDDGNDYAYQNTKNNRKLLDAVTYDDNGNVIPLSKRFNKRNADVRYAKAEEDIEAVNQRFNEDLDNYEKGKLPIGYRLQMGYPSAELRSAGFDNLPIYMRSSLIGRKAGDASHPYGAKDLKDFVKALQKPIAIFEYSKDNMRNLIVDVKHGDKHFLIGVTLNYESDGLEFNSVSGLFPKDTHEWIKWIQDGKAIRIDQKDKVQALIDSLRTNPAESIRIGLDLDTISDKVRDFKNPELPKSSSAKVQTNSETAKNNLQEGESENDISVVTRIGEGPQVTYTPYNEALKEAKKAGYTKAKFDRHIERVWNQRKKTAERFAEKLNLGDRVNVILDIDELEGMNLTDRQKRAKGWYDTKTGKIYVIMDNNTSMDDVFQTILHEGVAHHGLRELFGENFDTFLDDVYAHSTEDIRREIASLSKKYNWNVRTATEEYMATMAEKQDFEHPRYESWWRMVKDWFIAMVKKIGMGDWIGNHTITENELRFVLWRSWKNLTEPEGNWGYVRQAQDIAMQAELGVGEYADKAPYGRDWKVEKPREEVPAAASGDVKYDELKAQVPDKVIMMKNGELYEIKGEDAKTAAQLLGLPTGEDGVLRIPEDMMEKSLSKLVRSGKKVAIAEPIKGKDIARPTEKKKRNQAAFPNDKEKDDAYWSWVEALEDEKYSLSEAKELLSDAQKRLETAKGVSRSILEGKVAALKPWVDFMEDPDNQVAEDGIMLRDGEEELEGKEDSTPRVAAREVYEDMMSSAANQFTEAMQDSMLSLKKLYQAVMGGGKDFKIEDVAGYENAYLAENRMHSASQAQIDAWQKGYMKPIETAVFKLCSRKNKYSKEMYDKLTDYMMAKHGLERNEVMAKRDAQDAAEKGGDYDEAYNENRQRDYAGLTALTGKENVAEAEAEAQRMIAEYEAQHDVTELWKAVNAATGFSLERLYLSGMISKERYKQIRDMYQYYIPLQGFDNKVAEEVYAYMGNDGTMGYGTSIKTAKGRKSKADDPIATISMNGEATIRQTNRNEMKKTFLTFVQNHPSDLVSIQDVWLQKQPDGSWKQFFDVDLKETDTPAEVERKMYEFEKRMEQERNNHPELYKKSSELPDVPFRVVENRDMRQHQVMVQSGGKTYVLTINGNPRAAQALNGMTNPDVFTEGFFGKAMNIGQSINRTLSMLYTTRNPEFVISNFIRDAIYSNSMMWVKESPSYALKFHKNFASMVGSVKIGILFSEWENGKLKEKLENGTASETEQHFYDFMMNGGETGWTNLRDIEKHKKDLDKSLRREGNVSAKAWKAVGGAFDIINRMVENRARFAAYLTSRQMGRSIERSIWDAKEVSVNFNKKGSGDKFLNSQNQKLIGKIGAFISGGGRGLYVFWNAGIQGLNNISRAAGRKPGKFVAAVLAPQFILGAIAPLLAALIGDDGDDDPNNYYNLPEYVRRSNFCFRWSKDMPWITIPLPIEFRAIYGLGELATGAITGKERYSDSEMTKQVISQVSQVLPLDFMEGGGGFHAFIPSMLKPAVEAYSNEGWTGLPIYRKETTWTENYPEWQRAYGSANQQIVAATRWLNEATVSERDAMEAGGNKENLKGFINWNPARIEYLLKGYMGGAYTFVFDRLAKTGATILGKREFAWRHTPILSRVVKEGDERTKDRKVKNEYFDLLTEYTKTKYNLKQYDEEAAENDPVVMAKRIAYLNYDKKYLHYLIVDEYKPYLDNLKKLRKETNDKTMLNSIEAYETAFMKDMVELIHAVDSKGGLGDELRSKLEEGEIIDDKLRNVAEERLDALDNMEDDYIGDLEE